MDYLSGRVKKLDVGIPGYTNDTKVGEIVGDVNIQGDLNAESLKVNNNEVWHVGNKPSLGNLADVDDTSKMDKSIVVYNQAQNKYIIDDINTIITITDGGNF